MVKQSGVEGLGIYCLQFSDAVLFGGKGSKFLCSSHCDFSQVFVMEVCLNTKQEYWPKLMGEKTIWFLMY